MSVTLIDYSRRLKPVGVYMCAILTHKYPIYSLHIDSNNTSFEQGGFLKRTVFITTKFPPSSFL